MQKLMVLTRVLSGTVRRLKAPKEMDDKRPLSRSAQCLSLWCTAHRGSCGPQSHLREAGSELMLATDPRKAVVGLQGDRFGRYAAYDHRWSHSNVEFGGR